MAITKQVVNVDVAGQTALWYATDKSDFVLIDTVVNGENRDAVYQRVLDVDSLELPSTVRVGFYPKSGSSNRSVKAVYYVETSDSVLGTVTYEPLTITIAISGPGRSGGLDATNFRPALCNTASWLLPMGAVGADFLADACTVLQHGVVNTLHTLPD